MDRSILMRFPGSVTNAELEVGGWALDDPTAVRTAVRKTGTNYSWIVHRTDLSRLGAAEVIVQLEAILDKQKNSGQRGGRLTY